MASFAQLQIAKKTVNNNDFRSKKKKRPQNNLDVMFKCSDGKISAHLSILRFASQTISRAIGQDEYVPVIILVPDFSFRTVCKSLELIYTGSVDLKSEFEIEEIMDFVCNRLAIDMTLDWSIDGQNKANGSGVKVINLFSTSVAP